MTSIFTARCYVKRSVAVERRVCLSVCNVAVIHCIVGECIRYLVQKYPNYKND